jgi:hypothetical protein
MVTALASRAHATPPGTVPTAVVDTGAGALAISSDGTLMVRGTGVFQRLLGVARREGWESLPMGELVARIGLELRGSPYEAGTLDHNPDRELCTINFESFDCVTFVESALAFARMWKSGGHSIRELAGEIERIRYRGGVRDGYPSRLHYTTEWLGDNGRRRIAEWSLLIAAREEALSADTVRYVPREAIGRTAGQLADGDIVAFTTGIPGLDISHLGLIARDGEGRKRGRAAARGPREGVATRDVRAFRRRRCGRLDALRRPRQHRLCQDHEDPPRGENDGPGPRQTAGNCLHAPFMQLT